MVAKRKIKKGAEISDNYGIHHIRYIILIEYRYSMIYVIDRKLNHIAYILDLDLGWWLQSILRYN